MKRFESKVTLITGGGSGIGRACAELFAADGARVMVADVCEATGQETVRLVTDAGGEASFVRVDVTHAPDVESMVHTTVSTFGGIDVLHANAGYGGQLDSVVNQSDEEVQRLISVNLTGVITTCRCAIPRIVERGGGSIVITASIAGLVGLAGLGTYGATKWGTVGLTQVLALECAASGIRVNAVAPGYIDTPMIASDLALVPGLRELYEASTPLGRLGTPQEVARAVAYLCSEDASWVTGAILPVDGGAALQQCDLALSARMPGGA